MSDDATTPQTTTAPLTAPVTPPARDGVVNRALPIYVALVGALVTWVGITMLGRLMHVLLLVFISALLAAAMTGPVDFFERWRPAPRLGVDDPAGGARPASPWPAGCSCRRSSTRARASPTRVPERIEQYQGLQERLQRPAPTTPQLESLDEQVTSIGERIVSAIGERLVDLPQRSARVMIDLLAISVISALLVANRPRLQDFVLSLVHPRHREHRRRVVDACGTGSGATCAPSCIVMIIVGAITFVALFFLDVRFPLVLAGHRGVRRADPAGRPVDRPRPAVRRRGARGLADARPRRDPLGRSSRT